MYYFFHGTDADNARARARGVLSVMKKKRPEAEYFRMTADSWNSVTFEEFISGQGLFERKFIVFADGVLENADAMQWVISRISEIGKSENAFVFLEKKVDVSSIKKVGESAQEIKRFDLPASSAFAKKESGVFALADALGSRDKKKLWTLLSEALIRGETPEAISGILFWQIKSMIVAGSMSLAQSDLKPFVYTKSSRYAKGFTSEELQDFSRTLLSDYHDAHRGIKDLSVSLERFSLSL